MNTLPDFRMPRLTQYDYNLLKEKVTPSSAYDAGLHEVLADVLEMNFPGYKSKRRPSSRYAPFVYVIQAGEKGPLKIGVAGDPEKRLRQLQTGHHERLRLVLAFPGGRELEGALHKRLGAVRLGGEWFEPHPQLVENIRRMKARLYGAYGESCYDEVLPPQAFENDELFLTT